MRISDWSSDVCSSDLRRGAAEWTPCPTSSSPASGAPSVSPNWSGRSTWSARCPTHSIRAACTTDRKSVVQGKSVSVRVDLGGRRLIKTKTHTSSDTYYTTTTHNNQLHTKYTPT